MTEGLIGVRVNGKQLKTLSPLFKCSELKR